MGRVLEYRFEGVAHPSGKINEGGRKRRHRQGLPDIGIDLLNIERITGIGIRKLGRHAGIRVVIPIR
jgi:hypothetical protein